MQDVKQCLQEGKGVIVKHPECRDILIILPKHKYSADGKYHTSGIWYRESGRKLYYDYHYTNDEDVVMLLMAAGGGCKDEEEDFKLYLLSQAFRKEGHILAEAKFLDSGTVIMYDTNDDNNIVLSSNQTISIEGDELVNLFDMYNKILETNLNADKLQ